MQRGIQAIYNQFIEDVPPRTGEKGKRNAFKEERDAAIAYRFHYWGSICRKNWEDCQNELSREFFLAPSTITTILSEQNELLHHIKATKPDVAALRKLYPWMVWSVMRY